MVKLTCLQCASFNFYSYSYNFIDHARVPKQIIIFCFPQKQSERNARWNWSNENKRKMALEPANPLLSVRKVISPWNELHTSWR